MHSKPRHKRPEHVLPVTFDRCNAIPHEQDTPKHQKRSHDLLESRGDRQALAQLAEKCVVAATHGRSRRSGGPGSCYEGVLYGGVDVTPVEVTPTPYKGQGAQNSTKGKGRAPTRI